MASFADVKAGLDTLIAVFEAFMAKVANGEIVSQDNINAAVAEMQAEVDKIKAIP